jgi:hypothetical protein
MLPTLLLELWAGSQDTAGVSFDPVTLVGIPQKKQCDGTASVRDGKDGNYQGMTMPPELS